jgi:hypothetical protein
MNIRIIKTPPGEASEQIRQAWVGVTLPVPPRFASPRRVSTFGVLSRPKTFVGVLFALLTGRAKREEGYCVVAETAVELLARHSPDAAAWWRQHASRSIARGQLFLFAGDVCQEIHENAS